jgi:PKD repeat protein
MSRTLCTPIYIAGTYQVCLTVQNGCGTNQSCQPVEVNFAVSPLSVDATITPVQCHGDKNGSINVIVSGGSGNYTYNWTGAGYYLYDCIH